MMSKPSIEEILAPQTARRQPVKPLEKFYTEDPKWHEKIGAIHALLKRVKITEEQSGDVLHRRKRGRILSVHASTAIEGNQLTLGQVTDVINGKPVWGPPKDIKEVQNAWHAYNKLPGYAPWSVDDLLRAHAHLTDTLIGESGQFRSGPGTLHQSDAIQVFWNLTPKNRGRRRLHSFCAALNPQLLGAESLTWVFAKKTCLSGIPAGASRSYWNPTPKTASRHGLRVCHPHWNPLFAWMPMETLVHHNQALYHQALQDSHASAEVDCRPFIDFMLSAIANSLFKYIDVAEQTVVDVPVNVSVNVLVTIGLGELSDKILTLVRANPKMTAQKMALALGVTDKTIKRHLKALREQGRIQRIGSDKSGHWQIIERPL